MSRGWQVQPTSNLLKGIVTIAVCVELTSPLIAASVPGPAHGLWVWSTLTTLKAPGSIEALRNFCQAQGINEVYASVAEMKGEPEEMRFRDLIATLHSAQIRVEALLGSADADEAGPPRDRLLDQIRAIVHFNQEHGTNRFDGIHLDIEPQQRPENSGPGNLRFLPGLADTYRAARTVTEAAGMTIDADIAVKVLKGDIAQRQILLSALPRFTLMLYELSRPNDGKSAQEKAEKVRTTSARYLQTAYEGMDSAGLAQMGIGLRSPDYGDLLPQMLQALDEANGANPHYAGWARHSYNDWLKAAH